MGGICVSRKDKDVSIYHTLIESGRKEITYKNVIFQALHNDILSLTADALVNPIIGSTSKATKRMRTSSVLGEKLILKAG